MSTLYVADGGGGLGNEWARLNAADWNGGAAGDPSNYTGNRVGVQANTHFPNYPGTHETRITINGTESSLWTQSYGARTELGQHNGGSAPPGGARTEVAGQERWHGLWTFIPSTFPSSPAWCELSQLKCDAAGNGPISVGFAGNKLQLEKSNSQTYGNTNVGYPWKDPNTVTKRNAPIFLNIGAYWSTGSDGWYELWGDLADGQGYRQLKTRTPGWTLKFASNGGPCIVGPTICLYRQLTSSTDTIYEVFGVGTQRTDIEAAMLGATTGGGDTGGGTGGGTTAAVPVDVDIPATRDLIYADIESHLSATDVTLDPPAYPHFTIGTTRSWSTVAASHWTSGFLPGLFWRTYARTGVTSWRTAALAWQAAMESQKTLDSGDLGLMFMNSHVLGYKYAQDDAMRASAVTAAGTLDARYNAAVGAVRSWNSGVNGVTNFNTIIDSVMNMELLFWASRNGGAASLYTHAIAHMNTVRTNHMRANGSSFHVVEYNSSTGVVISKHTAQGFSDTSTWARGQAWALYGFAMAYREAASANQTDAANYLATAKAAAGYFLDNLPTDGMPKWDFDATDAQKDSSAAAIAAAGLVLLSNYDTSRDWFKAAHGLLGLLGDADYLATAAGTATTGSSAVLLHGTSAKPQNVGIDAGLIYGDEKFLEALDAYTAKVAAPVINQALSSVADTFDGTGALMPTRAGNVSVSGGQMKFTVDANVSRSYARSAANLVPSASAVIQGPLVLPAWVSGTGEVNSYITFDWNNNNRVVLMRKTTFGSGGTITTDVYECRLVVNNVDSAPARFNVSAIGAGVIDTKIGFLPGRIATYQYSKDGTTFLELVQRLLDSTMDVTAAGFLEMGLFKTNASDTIVVTTLAVGAVTGTTQVNANPGGTAVKSDTSLHFTGSQARVFPAYDAKAILAVIKPTNQTTPRAVAGVSSAAGGVLLDTFTRANSTGLGASYATASGTVAQPDVVSNQASSPASANSRALWNTSLGGADHSVYMTLGTKPPNPGAKLFNWINLLARITGTGAAATGYVFALALNTDGTASPFFTKIISGSVQSGLAGSTLPATFAIASGDSIGFDVVGSTLQAWLRPSGGVWALLGALTDTTYTTGNLVGFGIQSSGANVTSVDNLGGGLRRAATDPFPFERGGRFMRINASGVPQFHDATLSPEQGFGAGAIPTPPAWVGVLTTRRAADGIVATRIYNPATNTFSENENAGTLAAGLAITDSGARFVIGDREPNASTDMAFQGDVASVLLFSDDPGAAKFESIVQPGGVLTMGGAKAAGATHGYDMTIMTAATDQILDQIGTGHEITGEAVGTTTLVTDTGNVPFAEGTSTPVTPPPTISVPDGQAIAVTGIQVSPSGVTGQLTLTALTAPGTGNWTPNATPIEFVYSPDGGQTVVILGSQSALTRSVTGIPLDPGDGSTARIYAYRYLDNSTPAVKGALGPWSPPVFITANTSPLTSVDNPSVAHTPGQMIPSWDLPPGDEGVTGYEVWYGLAANPIPYGDPPYWTGVGTVSGNRVIGPTITGLSDTVRYKVGIKATKPE